MDKNTLNEAVKACKEEFHEVLQMISDELNKGQRQKLLKNETIKEIFDRFGVEY